MSASASSGSTSTPASRVTNSGGPPSVVATTVALHRHRLERRLAERLDQRRLAERRRTRRPSPGRRPEARDRRRRRPSRPSSCGAQRTVADEREPAARRAARTHRRAGARSCARSASRRRGTRAVAPSRAPRGPRQRAGANASRSTPHRSPQLRLRRGIRWRVAPRASSSSRSARRAGDDPAARRSDTADRSKFATSWPCAITTSGARGRARPPAPRRRRPGTGSGRRRRRARRGAGGDRLGDEARVLGARTAAGR